MSQHADRVRAAVARGDSVSAITASWRRCLDVYRLDPDDTGPSGQDLVALEQARARDAHLLEIAQPCLDQLFALLLDLDCCVLLADRDGLVLDLRTNRAADAWDRAPSAWLGSCCAEDNLGTTGTGTCLVEQRAVVIRGEQHFLARLINRVGISTPLFGPRGDLIACLSLNQSIASHEARLDSFLSIALSNFARRIETELFVRAHPATKLVLASPRGLRPDALLAVDPDNRVIGATRGARRLLELGDGMIARAPNVDEIFARSEANDALADVERRAIMRALARCDGNHSAAAKAIGISRSTLYRKLKSYATGPLSARADITSALKPLSSA